MDTFLFLLCKKYTLSARMSTNHCSHILMKNVHKNSLEGSTRETNLQRESSVLGFQSHLPGFGPVDSNDWPKIPTFRLKNRRTFTLFTTSRSNAAISPRLMTYL